MPLCGVSAVVEGLKTDVSSRPRLKRVERSVLLLYTSRSTLFQI